jgi:hypothetical protein
VSACVSGKLRVSVTRTHLLIVVIFLVGHGWDRVALLGRLLNNSELWSESE